MAAPRWDQLEAAREAARLAAENHDPTAKERKKKTAMIRALRPEIAKLRAQNRSWDEIAEAFRTTVNASAETFRVTFGKTVAKKKKKPPASVPIPQPAKPAKMKATTTKGFGPQNL